MSHLRRIASLLAHAAVIVTALTAAAVFLLPKLAGWQVATVLTGSMAPTHPAASVVAIAPVDADDVRVGDVIAFHADDGKPMVIHRVVAVVDGDGGAAFRTKGDANEDVDPNPVTATDLRGRVAFGVPLLGHLVVAVHTPLGLAGLVIVPGLALILREVLSLRRCVRADRAAATGPAGTSTAGAAEPSTAGPVEPATAPAETPFASIEPPAARTQTPAARTEPAAVGGPRP